MKVGRNLQSIIIAAALFAGLGAFSAALLLPSWKEMLKIKQELAAKQQQVETVSKTIVAGMEKFKKEKEALVKEYEALTEKLPMKNSFPELLNKISQQTQDLSVEVIAINRLQEKKDDTLNVLRVPVIIDLVTDYKTLGDYLKALDSMNLALTVRRLIINKDEKTLTPPLLRVQIELETYISLVE